MSCVMDVESVLITGANRGIGLELIRQLIELPKPPRYVFGTYRKENMNQALKDIRSGAKRSEVILIRMDVTKIEDIKEGKKVIEEKVGDRGLNLLINNAAVLERLTFPHLTEENMLFHYHPNTVAPVRVLQEMLPLLQKAASFNSKDGGMSPARAAVLNISSILGSVTYAATPPFRKPETISYRASKAALNMAMRVIAAEVEEQGILVVLMDPGWVKTDMGTKDAELEIEDSVSDIIKCIPRLNKQHQGVFIDRFGENIPF